jgi:DNA-binding NarL/FixJ family response regulator
MMKNILIIQHEKRTAERISFLLETEGYNITKASDGATGIKEAIQHLPDIILCDVNIPGISAYDVFNTICQINTINSCMFILIIKSSHINELKIASQLGVDGFIFKDSDISDIIITLKNTVKRCKQRLNKISNNYKKLLNNPFTGIALLDETIFIYCNQRLADILSINRNELIGQSIIQFIFSEDKEMFQNSIVSCVTGLRSEFTISLRIENAEKDKRKILLHGVHSRDKNKKLILANMLELSKQHESPYKTNKLCVKLTLRETEVLEMICQGYTNADISKILYLSERTIEGHRARIMNKANSKNTAELVRFAIAHGLFIC